MKILKIFFAVFLFSGLTLAQFGSIGITDARSVGMAKTYNAVSDGVYSLGINPANLSLMNQGSIEVSSIFPLPTISARGGTNFLSIEEINYYFGGVSGESRVLSEEDKTNLDKLFENGGSLFTNINLNWVSFSFKPSEEFGAFGISVTDFFGGKLHFPEAIADLFINGTTDGKVYDMNNSEIKSWWTRFYNISYSHNLNFIKPSFLDQFAFGFSVKFIQGFAYAGTEEVGTSFTTSGNGEINGTAKLLAYTSFSNNFGVKYEFQNEDSDFNFSLFPEQAGSGFGFDFGLSAAWDESWRISLAVTDIGKVNWYSNAATFISEGDILLDDITNKSQRDSVIDLITGTAAPVERFFTQLPTAIRFGISHKFSTYIDDAFPGDLLVAFDYNQGLNELPGNSLTPRLSFGAEWRIGFSLPVIRTGFGFGGIEGFTWSYGVGYDAGIVEFSLATNAAHSLIFTNASGWLSATLSSRWKIN